MFPKEFSDKNLPSELIPEPLSSIYLGVMVRS